MDCAAAAAVVNLPMNATALPFSSKEEECMVCLDVKTKKQFVQPTCLHDICKKCYKRCDKCPLCRASYNKPLKKLNAKEFGYLIHHTARAQMQVDSSASNVASSELNHRQLEEGLQTLVEEVATQERLRGIDTNPDLLPAMNQEEFDRLLHRTARVRTFLAASVECVAFLELNHRQLEEKLETLVAQLTHQASLRGIIIPRDELNRYIFF
jgi:hypothetical protein